MDKKLSRKIGRRLAPLYVMCFFLGFVLWYAVEKLFMHQIGFNDAGIGVMVAAYSTMMLLCETPSGILADRWSRKGVLMLATVFLAISGFLGGISTEPVLYVISTLVWGAFYALYSGTYETIIYDVIKEETGKSAGFDKYFGRYRMVDSIALVSGALIGGLLGEWLGLPATYFITVPLIFIALLALWKFKEPQLHKLDQNEHMVAHVKETFKVVLGTRALLPLVILMTALYVLGEILFEFAQLWYIALDTPVLLLGVATAAVFLATGLGGYLIGIIKIESRRLLLGVYAALLLGSLSLVFVPHLWVVVAAQFVVAIAYIWLEITTKRALHDQLPSRVRAGASSALSTTSRLLFIPTGLLFGWLSAAHGTFTAAWILVVLSAIAFVLECVRSKKAEKV